MANMHFLASIYGKGSSSNASARALYSAQNIPATQGLTMSFPSTGTVFYPIPVGSTPTNVFNGVTTITCIEVLPQGMNQPSTKYYTDATVSTLDTAAK